jgi:vancomycin resistance protein YoaR
MSVQTRPDQATTSPHQRQRLILFVAVGVIGAILAIYGIHRAASAGKVIGSVTVGDVELGGLTSDQAATAAVGLETRLIEERAPFQVNEQPLELEPQSIGFDLDENDIARRAMLIGREGNAFEQFGWWLGHIFTPVELPLQATLDSAALETVLSSWDELAVGNPPFEGGVELAGTVPHAVYPRAGEYIDRSVAPSLILASLSELTRTTTTLPTTIHIPTMTNADIDAAVVTTEEILSDPIQLINAEQERTLTFSPEQLASALIVTVDSQGVIFGFDEERVNGLLDDVRADLEEAPVDATFSVGDFRVSVIPGRKGTLIDTRQTIDQMLAASQSSGRNGFLPIVEGADPETTTEELEALNIHHLVSQFTTYYDPNQPRVTNIQLIADETDGALLRPGQTFSLNEYVGERTLEEGYVEAPGIEGGELVPSVGGGTSQFTTTLYNAVFWGGYQDVSHKPHSFYFSRYPLGIEATLFFPEPDLKFRNNTNSGLLIKTSYTDTSITVRIYGDNDGRFLRGEQRGGETTIRVVESGGAGARKVEATTTEPHAYTEPPDPLIRGNPELGINESETVQTAAQGFTVEVTRRITVGDDVTERTWVVRYSPRREITEVAPCKVNNSCPTTTTTTTTTTTPSTTQPPTTTAN